jgi:hypothetical protein
LILWVYCRRVVGYDAFKTSRQFFTGVFFVRLTNKNINIVFISTKLPLPIV